jgi:hypothetical protein
MDKVFGIRQNKTCQVVKDASEVSYPASYYYQFHLQKIVKMLSLNLSFDLLARAYTD